MPDCTCCGTALNLQTSKLRGEEHLCPGCFRTYTLEQRVKRLEQQLDSIDEDRA